MKIIELLVDDALLDDMEVGIDGIALVNRPAHEENWLAFSEEKEKKNIYEVLDNEKMAELAELVSSFGETEESMEEDGYELYRVEELSKETFAVGDITSTPNASSMEDFAGFRVRYKYVGPAPIPTSRDFCVEMLRYNRIYRIEDIDRMTAEIVNEDFGLYDIFKWRGSYNCRHRWVKVIYAPKDKDKSYADNLILNNADRRRNVREVVEIPQESTMTDATANNRRVRLSTNDFKAVGTIDGVDIYENREEAHEVSRIMGCGGDIHIHNIEGKDYYMPCAKHPKTELEDLYDVPQYARDKACKARKYKEENPEVDCGTRTGWIRSSQLCSGEKVSRDIIGRMASFARHLPNAEKQNSYEEGCALLMVDAWGGKEGIEWAQGVLDREDFEEDGLEGACWPGYEAIGTKILNGRRVPNCVKKSDMDIDVSSLRPYKVQTGETISNNLYLSKEGKESLMKFSLDEDKMEITGAALIPNKLIIRTDMLGNPYYVFFSKETIKKLAYKFMKEGRTQSTNIEHTSKKAEDTFVAQSWIVEDEETDKSRALGLDYEEGTWVITMKTDSPEVWAEIKEGKYKGFSVEGFFEEKLVLSKDDYLLDNIKNILKSI